MPWVWIQGPTWYKEKIDSFKLSSDRHMWVIVHMRAHKHAHNTLSFEVVYLTFIVWARVWSKVSDKLHSPDSEKSDWSQRQNLNIYRYRTVFIHDNQLPANNTPLVCATSSVAETEITSAVTELAGYYGLERYTMSNLWLLQKGEAQATLSPWQISHMSFSGNFLKICAP